MNLNPVNMQLLALAAATAFCAIRQADWKHPVLIWGLISIASLMALISCWPAITGYYSYIINYLGSIHMEHSGVPSTEQIPTFDKWQTILFASATILAFGATIYRAIFHIRTQPAQWMSDALVLWTAIYFLLLSFSTVFEWPARPDELIRSSGILMTMSLSYVSITLILEFLRSLRRTTQQALVK
jgi:hypothetical protein